MKTYRTHTCSELNLKNNGEEVLLSGWINKKRDHGNLLFIDLRDYYGITQCVIENNNKFLQYMESKPDLTAKRLMFNININNLIKE